MANCARYEPTIDEIMADPTVKALMKADHVNPDRLRTKLVRLGDLMAMRDGPALRNAKPLKADGAIPAGFASCQAFG